jgi:hypothetical protein
MPPTPGINGRTAVGASTAIAVPYGVNEHVFESWFTHNATSASLITAATIKVQGSMRDDGENGVINAEGPVLAIGSTAENVANSAFDFRIANVNYSKAAVSAGTAFTSAHVVTASKFGAIGVYINSAGTILTLSAKLGQSQTTALASASAAAAITAHEAIPIPAGYAYLGYVLIEADGGGWTVTDDLTDGSDLTTATFNSVSPAYVNIDTFIFNSDDLQQLRKSFTISNTWFKYMRMYLSTLTGTGKFYAQHHMIHSAKRGK